MTTHFSRCAGLMLALAIPAAHAGGFGVAPIRLDFDSSVKTGAITVSSDDTARLSFQMKLFEWSQDKNGKDQYKESSDLIFFPQLMTLQPKDKRIIRVGTKSPPAAAERTYRLFIEELPDANAKRGKGAQVAVKLRFGVPLFVAPIEPRLAGTIEDAALAKGEVRLRVRNTGNQHFRFETISASAGGAAIGQVEGWYLLAGAARSYTIKVDPQACAKAGRIEVALSAGSLEIKRELEATPVLCRP